ncbi:PilZ domain-containing protein [Thiospirillum jenense]|uniref:PilZ domain-containing protein n=1 Tax=Thiospirillum jenense TaxID=1653858 RepID=A0A839HMJ0_9GAMM|nr:PilZ domain-containing protein [Thiospirillum jenense]MBB1126732.1 PilZ domain-containing protein [Thiospirillum jenense]
MIEEEERRRFMRLNAETQATITRLATQETAVVNLIDLSACGCAFFTTLAVKLDEKIAFMVDNPNPNLEPLQRYAMVTRLSRGQEKHLVAVEFVIDDS